MRLLLLSGRRRGRAAGGGGEGREREGHAPVGGVLARAAPLLAHELAHPERIGARWRDRRVGLRRVVEHGARGMVLLMRVLLVMRLPGRLAYHLVEGEAHAAPRHGRRRGPRAGRRLLLMVLRLLVLVVVGLVVREGERLRWLLVRVLRRRRLGVRRRCVRVRVLRHGGGRWLRVRVRRLRVRVRRHRGDRLRRRLSLRDRSRHGRRGAGGGGGGERRDVLGLHFAQI